MNKEHPGRDRVLLYITEFLEAHGTYPDISTISTCLQRDKHTVKRHIVALIDDGAIENRGNFYSISQSYCREPVASGVTKRRLGSAINWIEINDAKRKVKIGDKVLISDWRYIDPEDASQGRAVYARVISKHKHLVRLEHNLSCTYIQLAKWYRNGKVAIE